MARRHVAAVLAVTLLASTAGCSFVLGQGPLEFNASPVAVQESSAHDAGYRLTNKSAVGFSTNVSRYGVTRRVEVTNHVAVYERSISLGPAGEHPAAVFTVFSSPQASVFGQSFNPIGQMDSRALLERVLQGQSGVTVSESAGTAQTTVLGESTTVHTFTGTSRVAGQEVDTTFHVTTVEHDGDYVVAVSAYPTRVDGERDRAFRMFQGVTHGT